MATSEQERIELYKNIFVEKGELSKILDQHGSSVADNIMGQLKPELKSIDLRLTSGHEKYDRNSRRIQEIQLQCAKTHPEHSPTRTPDQTYKVPPEHVSNDYLTEGMIKKKTAVILAIIASSIFVISAIILGIFYIKSLFPF